MPDFVTEASGKGKVEAFTVIYKGKGEVEHGVVMMRTEADARALARIPASDGATLKHLLNLDRTPVGSVGNDRHGRGRRAGVAGGVASARTQGLTGAATPANLVRIVSAPFRPCSLETSIFWQASFDI